MGNLAAGAAGLAAVPAGLTPDILAVEAQARDADRELVERALAVVRRFIVARKLLLYGGLGLDYALRLKHSRIYPDEERPDFDMLSARSVDDAYDLAEELAELGFPKAEAIRAMHVQTVRVRVNFTAVADLSYAPPAVLSCIPRISYGLGEGGAVDIIDPHWQFMDQHQAFCFPYRDPPREPVFHRFGKDLRRFNILLEHYPLAAPAGYAPPAARAATTFPLLAGCALHGVGAYHLLLLMLEEVKGGAPAPQTARGRDDGVFEITFPCPPGTPFTVATTGDPGELMAKLGYAATERFRPLMDLAPCIVVGRNKDKKSAYPQAIYVYSHPGRLVAATHINNGVRVVSPQYLLMHFLLGYNATLHGIDTAFQTMHHGADYFLWHYLDVLRAINAGQEAMASTDFPPALNETERFALINATPFSLTTQFIGDLNIGASQLVTIAADAQSTLQAPASAAVRELLPSPEELKMLPARRYTPGGVRPVFDYNATAWFRQDGGAE
jgi:hypothetical protein